MFGYKNGLAYPVFSSDEKSNCFIRWKFEDCMDLLLMIDANNQHYVYVNDFDGFMYYKTKHKKKKLF